MVIKASKLSGIICESRSSAQAQEFRLFVDPVSLDSKADLTLMTKMSLPISSVSPMELIAGPGEYEVMGIKVRGITPGKEVDEKYLHTVYLVEMDGLRLCFLGERELMPDDDFIENVGTIDVLFVNGISDSKDIISLIKDIDPRIVVCRSKEKASLLSKELGQTVEPTDKETIKKKDLDGEGTKLIWLTSKEK
ncbi:MAG: MBL fold metallo-hydrolase [bacterium]|nr:MBL fold metallo-hydrolase [bacterium]